MSVLIVTESYFGNTLTITEAAQASEGDPC